MVDNKVLDTLISYKANKKVSKSIYMDTDQIVSTFNLDSVNKDDSVLVIDALEILPYLSAKGVTDVTYIQYGKSQDEHHCVRYFGYNYINVLNKHKVSKIEMSKKFDVIMSSPSYGNTSLHNKVFEKSYELLKEGGVMTCIQPSTPFVTAYDDKSGDEDKSMRDIVINNKSSINLLPPTTMNNVMLFYPLSATTVTKEKSDFEGVDTFTDMKDNVYLNVNIDDVNTLNIKPELYRSMLSKVLKLIGLNGCLRDIVYWEDGKEVDDTVLKLSKVRGNYGKGKGIDYNRSRTFFSWISVDGIDGLPSFQNNRDKTKFDFGLVIGKDMDHKVAYSYFKTNFARFCMALGKHNHAVLGSSCELTTPIVDFSVQWTDEQLFDLVGFTDEEIAEVNRVITPLYS